MYINKVYRDCDSSKFKLLALSHNKLLVRFHKAASINRLMDYE